MLDARVLAMLDARFLAMHIVSAKAAGLASATASGAIKLAGIAKSFGETRVLRGIDLDIRAGEFITILGPSGCGKSTLLRIIAGLERQSGGTVAIDGRSVDALPPDRRDIAMVFQSYALYPHLTVAENIAVPLRMRRLSRLQRLPGAVGAPRGNVILGKLEGNNPAGSVKDRPALSMIKRAQARGQIKVVIVVDIHSMIALDHLQIPATNVSAVGELVKYFKKFKSP